MCVQEGGGGGGGGGERGKLLKRIPTFSFYEPFGSRMVLVEIIELKGDH